MEYLVSGSESLEGLQNAVHYGEAAYGPLVDIEGPYFELFSGTDVGSTTKCTFQFVSPGLRADQFTTVEMKTATTTDAYIAGLKNQGYTVIRGTACILNQEEDVICYRKP